jgi:hypothetical protein
MAQRNPYDKTWSMRTYRFGLQTKRKVQDILELSIESVEELLEPGIDGAERPGSGFEEHKGYGSIGEYLEQENTLDSLEKEQQYDK